MRRKIFAIGAAILFITVLSLSFLVHGPKILIFRSWLHGNQFILNNSSIKLGLEDYFLPQVDKNHVFIQKISSEEGLLEVSSGGLSLNDGRSFLLDECKVRGCISIMQRMSSINGRKVTAIELHFKDQQTGESVKAFCWIEGVPIFIQFDGPADVYPRYQETISNIIKQVSR